MLVPMTPVTILAPRTQLPTVIAELHRQGLVHLTDTARQETGMTSAGPGPGERSRLADLRAELSDLAQLLGLAETAASVVAAGNWLRPVTAVPADQHGPATDGPPGAGRTAAGITALLAQIESLQAEHEAAVRYRDALAVLVPLEPELALLSESDLARLSLAVVVLVLDAPHAGVLDSLRGALHAAVGDRFHMAGAETGEQTVGCVLVLPHAVSAELHTLLEREHIRHVPVPDVYGRLSLAHALTELENRLTALPDELARAWRALAARTSELAPGWRRRREQVLTELDHLEALTLAGASTRTAAVSGWLPRHQVAQLRAALAAVGPGVTVTRVDTAAAGEPPTLLDNPPRVRPYQQLITFFGLPRSGGIDPSMLTAAVLPLLFGIMVGDLVYGAILAGLGAIVRRRGLRSARPLLRDTGSILAAGGAWSMLFGLLFGEALGSLGHKLGLPALWFYRGGSDSLGTLLLLATGIGVTHVLLSLLLGMRQAQRLRQPRTLIERAGTFFLLIGLAAVAGTAADLLPGQVRTPAMVLVAVMFVVAISARGVMGLLTGPLELLGTLGHVLSYLRLAAVGLASVYLAAVANELAVSVPLLLGVLVAALLHLLNLALAAFSPMVQALRLHYVEFFSGFYETGGLAFRPFGRRPEPAPD
jgi:V/A-type H+/Na+-transporting ATPase subunit I